MTASTTPHSPFGHVARLGGHKGAQRGVKCESHKMCSVFPQAADDISTDRIRENIGILNSEIKMIKKKGPISEPSEVLPQLHPTLLMTFYSPNGILLS